MVELESNGDRPDKRNVRNAMCVLAALRSCAECIEAVALFLGGAEPQPTSAVWLWAALRPKPRRQPIVEKVDDEHSYAWALDGDRARRKPST